MFVLWQAEEQMVLETSFLSNFHPEQSSSDNSSIDFWIVEQKQLANNLIKQFQHFFLVLEQHTKPICMIAEKSSKTSSFYIAASNCMKAK